MSSTFTAYNANKEFNVFTNVNKGVSVKLMMTTKACLAESNVDSKMTDMLGALAYVFVNAAQLLSHWSLMTVVVCLVDSVNSDSFRVVATSGLVVYDGPS